MKIEDLYAVVPKMDGVPYACCEGNDGLVQVPVGEFKLWFRTQNVKSTMELVETNYKVWVVY